MRVRLSAGQLIAALVVVGVVLVITLGRLVAERDKDAGDSTANLTGYKGAVALGLGIEHAPGKLINLAEPPRSLAISLLVETRTSSCSTDSRSLSCPTNDASLRIGLQASALLDFMQRVPVNGDTPFEVVNSTTPKKVLKLQLPRLADGHHCILVSVVEDEQTVVEAELPSHDIAALFFLQVGHSASNHCEARWQADGSEITGVDFYGCVPPVLSVKPDAPSLRRQVVEEAKLWAIVPACPVSPKLVLLRDGVPWVEGSRTLSFPEKIVSSLSLGALPEGSWRAVLVLDSPRYIKAPNAFVSEPVIIDYS